MKDNIKLWAFIVLLPFFAAIGHDLYANYYATDEQKAKLEAFQIDPKAYQVSDLGYIFMKYTPEQFQTVREMVGEESWTKWVDPVLQKDTYVIALIPAVIFFAWLLIARVFDAGPFTGSVARGKGKNGSDSFTTSYEKKNEFKYKRK